MAAAPEAGVSGQGVLVCRQCTALGVWMRTVQAVQMQWGEEEGRKAVQIWRPQGGAEEKGSNASACS